MMRRIGTVMRGEEVVSEGEVKVCIICKKINNTVTTILIGLDWFVPLKDGSKALAKTFGTAAVVKAFESKDAVYINGYWLEELKEILQEEFGVGGKLLSVEDKLGKKSKRDTMKLRYK